MQMKSIILATLNTLFVSSTVFFTSYLLMLSPVTRVLAQSTETSKKTAKDKVSFTEALSFTQKIKNAHSGSNALAQLQTNTQKAEADRLIQQGNKQLDTSQFRAALGSYQQALKIYQSIKDQKGEGYALGGLGLAYDSLGDYKRAIDYYSQALQIVKAIGDQQSEARSLGNLGNAYDSLGDYKRAIDYHTQALQIVKAIGDRQWEARSLGNLGNAYDSLGDYKRAIDYQTQSLAIAKAIGDRQSEAGSLVNLGNAYDSLGDYKRAIDYHTQGLAIAKAIGDRQWEAGSLVNLGNAYNSLGDYKRAIDYYSQGLAIAKAIGDRQWEAGSLGGLGNAYDSLGDYKRAIDYQTQSLAIAKAIGDRQSEAISLNNLGVAYLVSANPKAAEENLRKAIAVYESIRKDLGSNDAFKISIFETQADSYRLLQQALVAQNRKPEALLIAESGRAQALIELLAGREQLSRALVPPSIEQIQQIAKQQNATLVEYSIAWNDLYIWVVKPTGEITFEKVDIKQNNLANAAEDTRVSASNSAEGRSVAHDLLTGLVDKTRSTLSRTYGSTPQVRSLSCRGNNCLQQMYQLLIQPIEKQLPTNPDSHVIFIPHESLFLVPFAALQDQNQKFLIEKHTISIAPSIQVLELIHQQKLKLQPPSSTAENSLGDALIVGNPTMPKVPPRIGEPPQPLEPLPGAETEANTIAHLLKTQALTGKQATLAIVKQRMQKARIIHLATHGLLDDLGDAQIIPGKVALAPSKGDDGLLSANDVLKLKLNASLVVLSACDTGWGRITGDGVIGLPRVFITAGVPSIVVSLWRVPDQSTAFLMPEFYRQLQHNRDKAHALRQAMLETMKKYPNPSDWAAFVFIGEAE